MQEENRIQELEDKLKACEDELNRYRSLYRKEQCACAKLTFKLTNKEMELDHFYHTLSWRITAPLRWGKRVLKKIPPIGALFKFLWSVRHIGFKGTVKKIKRMLRAKKAAKKNIVYTEAELHRQRNFRFENPITFSIIVPLYNTPREYLEEMIASVKAQTYAKWELCLADGSDAEHGYVGELCLAEAEADGRIKYKKLEKNLGISENTNAAIEMSTGDYIALFDHDDKLHPAALFEMARAVADKVADFIYTDEAKFVKDEKKDAYDFFFKPDFSPDTLRGCNYICHFTAFARTLYESVGGFRSEFDGSQDYDIILRLTEKAQNIVHITKILYYWRCHSASVASDITAKPYTLNAAKAALLEHLERVGLKGRVEDSSVPSMYRIKYDIDGEPLVSIIIPNKDHISDLEICLNSIYAKTTYKNFEIIVVENNSTEPETFAYYKKAESEYERLKVVYWEGIFNYSEINNFGFEHASGEYVILLNNDIEIITPEWIEEMLMFTQRPDVGICGMMLYYPDDTVQHAGVIIGLCGVAGHAHKYYGRGESGYFGRMSTAQNYSAVTAAAMMVKSSVYREVGGLDESFAVAFNDIDLCMRVRTAGYLIIWTPYAEAYHYESKSRGLEDTPEKIERFNGEINNFQTRWSKELAEGDPYYNPNLTLEKEKFQCEVKI